MIGYDKDDEGFVTLTWDLPGRSQNVFNEASLAAWAEALERALADDAVRGVVVTSAKKTFLAGADLEAVRRMAYGAHSAAELDRTTGALGALLRRQETGGKPIVAALNGSALGGGYELALACHRVIAADVPHLRVGLPEVQLGLLPGAGGTQRLPRRIGVRAALPYLMEGKQLRAAEALAAGLVDEVVPPERLVEAAKAWLRAGPDPRQPWDRKGYRIPGGGLDDKDVTNLFMVATAMYAATTHGNYPAGEAILSCVYEGLRMPLDHGLAVEKRQFIRLLLHPTSGAMIRTMFFGLQEANKLARRPEGPPRLEVRRLGVLGAGLMGAGIAYVAALRGIDVVVLDVDEARARGAVTYAEERLAREVAKGRRTAEDAAAVLGRIRPTASYDALAGADCVIEAVFEDRAVKARVTAAADAALDEHAVLASNTSTLPITGLAEASSRPHRFIGLHFFSPVERMQLVEVIRPEQATDATLAHALDVVAALGKTPIVVRDRRGFYTSRVFGTYVNEGMTMLLDGVPWALVEAAGRRSGMPMPPLALCDEVGIGLMHSVGEATRADLGDATPPNPSQEALDRMVRLGRTGKRAGKGFYTYEGGVRRPWAELAQTFPPSADPIAIQGLVDRLLVVQAVEAARCMEEGLLLSPVDADVGAVLGWGFAPWTGGPLALIERDGVDAFVAKADALADAHGERFRPPALLRRMAAEGARFHAAG